MKRLLTYLLILNYFIMNLAQAKTRLNWLWTNGHEKGIKSNSEKIVIVGNSTRTYMDGTSEFIGNIEFDRYTDTNIFHTVVNNRYTPNEIGKEVSIRHSNGGGTAWYEFNPLKINDVINELKKYGYSVFLDLEKDIN